MRQVIVKNLTTPNTPILVVDYCDTFFSRLRGLTFRRNLHPSQGILIVQPRENRLDSAIHMMGVWMNLAVAWINAAGVVVDVRLARAWRPMYIPRHPARFILEMAPIRLMDFQVGDEVRFEAM
jgi:uncharacterized membrane protein (UPF0127 family)